MIVLCSSIMKSMKSSTDYADERGENKPRANVSQCIGFNRAGVYTVLSHLRFLGVAYSLFLTE